MDIWYKILAILGACAWLPPIIQLFIKYFTKVKITIIPYRIIEIGYNINGPIINLALALSAENSECLITNIEIQLHGPNQERHNLKWEWFEEKLYEIEYAASELGLTPIKKQQNAIAIKILKEGLVEKKVGFHETAYKINHDQAYNAINQQFELLSKNNQDVFQLKATQEYDKLKNLLENSLIWKEGTYDGIIKVTTLDKSRFFTENIKFRLSANQIRSLQANILSCVRVLENAYFPSEELYQPKWNWITTNILDN
ncbi:hypothetical protein [Mucilaginibacter sp.]|jgi:hypothetical protein|uniref:hypothetical protein n=1 Tax=Mucilaginibacter sp. TaxID=1882438 RepID=UPI002D12DF52|nr:hypothetical protein [Mucilaginibacter sp.]HTI61649.1 hypothetical protein [Mucilaginibacter sp.]